MLKQRPIVSGSKFRPMAFLLPASMVLPVVQFSAVASGQITNPETAFPITIDGQFTNAQEWSDVTPAAFISSTAGTTPTNLGNPSANSYLYATIGDSGQDLYLMYDDVGFTSPLPASTLISDVSFPVELGPSGPRAVLDVQATTGAGPTTPGSLNVVDESNNTDLSSASIGLVGAIGFSSSPSSSTPHLMFELEVPLLISPGFGPGFPANGDQGPNGGGYSSNPAYWEASALTGGGGASPAVDPPISAGIFTINPDGSLTVLPVAVTVPEPGTLGLLGLCSTLLLRRKRPGG